MDRLDEEIFQTIRFCKNGFGDIFPIFDDPTLFRKIVREMSLWVAEELRGSQRLRVDRIAGIEARGALLATVIAHQLGLPLSIVRHSGALPRELASFRQTYRDYSGEEKALEISSKHFPPGENVVLVDDWVETGETLVATKRLVNAAGSRVIAVCAMIDGTFGKTDVLSQQPSCALLTLNEMKGPINA